MAINTFVRVTPDEGIIWFLLTQKQSKLEAPRVESSGPESPEWSEEERFEVEFHMTNSLESGKKIKDLFVSDVLNPQLTDEEKQESRQEMIITINRALSQTSKVSDSALRKVHPELPMQFREKYQPALSAMVMALEYPDPEAVDKFGNGAVLLFEFDNWVIDNKAEFSYPPKLYNDDYFFLSDEELIEKSKQGSYTPSSSPENANYVSEKEKKLIDKAEQGDVDAQFRLAMSYSNKPDISRSPKNAAKWFRKAAELGHSDAAYKLYWMYSVGDGVPKDQKEEAKWFRKAAESGHAEAQFALALMYGVGKSLWGEKIQKDNQKAFQWFQKAAYQGHAEAQFQLGYIYAFGEEGVPKDEIMAYALFRLAGNQGHKEAFKYKEILYTKLSKQEVKQGRKIVEEIERQL